MTDQLVLTLKDRLMLANQYRILEGIYPKEAARYAACRKIVEIGFTGQYDRLIGSMSSEMSPDDGELVAKVLELYRALHQSFGQLRDREGLDSQRIQFCGFDRQTEAPLMQLAQHLVPEIERSSAFQHCFFESREPMAARYRRMLSIWAGLGHRATLSKQEIQAILAA